MKHESAATSSAKMTREFRGELRSRFPALQRQHKIASALVEKPIFGE
jgi:hypothetical protein